MTGDLTPFGRSSESRQRPPSGSSDSSRSTAVTVTAAGILIRTSARRTATIQTTSPLVLVSATLTSFHVAHARTFASNRLK